MSVSVIIPVYNEQKTITQCLKTLLNQSVKDKEIIVVDDGSSDETKTLVKGYPVTLLEQKHGGPGQARNLGAAKAKGEILVFVDADMTFERDFLEKLIAPINSGKTIGTFSKEEYLANSESSYARCWNLNLGRQSTKMHPDDYPDQQEVFRAILKKMFDEVGGFDSQIGYTDDWSLSRKLKVKATDAPGAKYYHSNPETLTEVWIQARWFGKNEFLTKNLARRLYNLFRYFPPFAIVKGIIEAIKFQEPNFFAFKIVYDSAVFTSVCLSFIGETKAR